MGGYLSAIDIQVISNNGPLLRADVSRVTSAEKAQLRRRHVAPTKA